MSMFWLSHLACLSSVPRDSQAENQAKQQARQPALNDVAQVNRQEQKQAEGERRVRETLTDAQSQALVKREFEGLFEADGQTISPSHLVGDFNGDDVVDVAIYVRLSQSIDPSDKAEPRFWFGKPLGPGMRDDDKRYTFKMGDLARYRSEPILIVLHGKAEPDPTGSEPKQRFVIVDGWDADAVTMRSYRGKLWPAAAGDSPIEPPPHLLGDAILILGRENRGTALYWDGNRYRWYPVDHAP